MSAKLVPGKSRSSTLSSGKHIYAMLMLVHESYRLSALYILALIKNAVSYLAITRARRSLAVWCNPRSVRVGAQTILKAKYGSKITMWPKQWLFCHIGGVAGNLNNGELTSRK